MKDGEDLMELVMWKVMHGDEGDDSDGGKCW